VEAGTALPSPREEGHLLKEGHPLNNEEIFEGAPDEASGKTPDRTSDKTFGTTSNRKESAPPAPAPDPFQELTERISALQSDRAASEAAGARLASKIASLEAELAKTREEAARREREMAADVEAERERARTDGRAKGYAEGLESGHRSGLEKARAEVQGEYRERLTGLVAALEVFSARLEENFAELVALNRPRMLRLWQEMLKKMLRREMTLAPDAVLDVLGDVLARLSDKNHLVIYVSPEDMALLEERMQEEFADILRGARHLELKSDTNVDRGSCIVETNLGIYDARWRTQLDQIETVIEDLLQKLGKAPKVVAVPPRRRSAADDNGAAAGSSMTEKNTTEKNMNGKIMNGKNMNEKGMTGKSAHRRTVSAAKNGRVPR
jgi:flagellar assembly protein FliH